MNISKHCWVVGFFFPALNRERSRLVSDAAVVVMSFYPHCVAEGQREIFEHVWLVGFVFFGKRANFAVLGISRKRA